MKKTLLTGIVGLSVALVLAGCATGGGMSPEEQVAKAIDEWAAAMAEEDLDSIMNLYSEDFEHYEWGDKEGVEDFMSQAIDMGYIEDIEVIMDDVEYTTEDDTIIAYPIELVGAFGSVTLELVFAKEADGYKVIELDASGI